MKAQQGQESLPVCRKMLKTVSDSYQILQGYLLSDALISQAEVARLVGLGCILSYLSTWYTIFQIID
jgi:hypothetical protein